jgi:hypothetical protein
LNKERGCLKQNESKQAVIGREDGIKVAGGVEYESNDGDGGNKNPLFKLNPALPLQCHWWRWR